jgi:NAD(P)-dependent dehydrogenase (short-subunit alcohol dehydrogenase family)
MRAMPGDDMAEGRAKSVLCDVADPRSARAAIDAAVSTFGALHVLVNNAAAETPRMTVDALELADWNRALEVNLTGAFLMSKFAVPHIAAAGGGSIIHVASQLGRVGAPGRAAYGVTKAGLIQLARIMALDHAAQNIRVNALSPGAVLTGRVVRSYGSPEAAERALIPNHPIGRLGTPAEIAAAALYLASDESAFMTGADLLIDGGYTAR